MERDTAQSLLDERFPHGVRVVVHDAGMVFNTPRLMVIDDKVIRCGPHGWSRDIWFTPQEVVENDDGTATLVGATPKGYDVLLDQPPEAVWEELELGRKNLYNDELLNELRGGVTL